MISLLSLCVWEQKLLKGWKNIFEKKFASLMRTLLYSVVLCCTLLCLKLLSPLTVWKKKVEKIFLENISKKTVSKGWQNTYKKTFRKVKWIIYFKGFSLCITYINPNHNHSSLSLIDTHNITFFIDRNMFCCSLIETGAVWGLRLAWLVHVVITACCDPWLQRE